MTVAFNAGNLEPVCACLRAKFPSIKIVLIVDDDFETDGNPGITKAIDAAEKHHAKLVIPQFSSKRETGDTDFNDLFRKEGAEKALACLEDEFSPEELKLETAKLRVQEAIEKAKKEDSKDYLDEKILPSWRLLKEENYREFQKKRDELKGLKEAKN